MYKQDQKRKMILSGVWILVVPVFFSSLLSQTTIVKDSPFIKGTTVVIPGKEYKRSG